MTNFNSLIDDDLDQVTGGMDCKTAIYVAKFWNDVAGILGAMGNTQAASAATGRANGVMDAGCPG
jgi:hypothetical protein